MSAASRPVCGRASVAFATLTAKAGRLGTDPCGEGWLVRGHAVGGVPEGDADVDSAGAAVPWAFLFGEQPAVTRAAAIARQVNLSTRALRTARTTAAPSPTHGSAPGSSPRLFGNAGSLPTVVGARKAARRAVSGGYGARGSGPVF